MATHSPPKKESDDFLKGKKKITKNLNQCHLSPIKKQLIEISHMIHYNTPIVVH